MTTYDERDTLLRSRVACVFVRWIGLRRMKSPFQFHPRSYWQPRPRLLLELSRMTNGPVLPQRASAFSLHTFEQSCWHTLQGQLAGLRADRDPRRCHRTQLLRLPAERVDRPLHSAQTSTLRNLRTHFATCFPFLLPAIKSHS